MTDTNKLREDTQALKDLQYQEEVREMLRRLDVPEEEILNIEKDENIPKLMEAKELVKKLADSELFEKNENGTYKVYAKVTALSLLSASVGMMDDLGVTFKGVPYFTGVSRWLDINVSTLRRWWDNQSLIYREEISLGSAAVQRIVLKHLELAELYTDGLKLTPEQMAELKTTPKGINVMMKAASQALYIAKFLSTQGDVITKADQLKTVQEGSTKHGVTVLFPVETKKPVEKYKQEKDGNDITDRE